MKEEDIMKITLGKERVIVRGIRPEEHFWGPYQFPLPYQLEDRIVVCVHVHGDGIQHWGKTNRWFESFDQGVTWKETDPAVDARCGLLLPNGDRVYFPPESAADVSGYRIPGLEYLTPGYDFSKKAEDRPPTVPPSTVISCFFCAEPPASAVPARHRQRSARIRYSRRLTSILRE